MTEQQTMKEGTQAPPQSEDGYSQSQGEFDQAFAGIQARQPKVVEDLHEAYWDLAEGTLRTARKVSERVALALVEDEIVARAAGQAVRILRQNPQLIRPDTSQR